jgi:CBS domain-containing protein
MKCADIMSRNLEVLSETDTIERAATLMAETGVGFLPIADAHRKVVGVVTDRDLATRGLARRLQPATTSAAMIMSSPVVTCPATADLADAERLMARERKSRIVITDEDGKLAGVLSLVDLIESGPSREALTTARAVLWREALGPRGGAARGEPLLRDDPNLRNAIAPSDTVEVRPSIFTGGHHDRGSKEFPG